MKAPMSEEVTRIFQDEAKSRRLDEALVQAKEGNNVKLTVDGEERKPGMMNVLGSNKKTKASNWWSFGL